ncbi:MAG: proteasome subunit beta [Candidatus Diapherotrites archaeon]|nr:proteasome subunit beta [Candidatus Diapherotrites archaeon]
MENKELKTGTTTVGIKIKDAIVLAADMRASMGHIAYEEESQKIYKITDYLAITNAGSVGDSLAIIRFLTAHAKLYEIERAAKFTPKAAATLLSNILNANRYFPFLAQFIIGGINETPELYEVDPSGGLLERKQYAVSGSGTEFALNTLDSGYSEDMTKDEAIALAIKAIEAGKKRDVFSGGLSVSVVVINKEGVKELSQEEISKIIESQKQKKAKK